MLTDSVKRESSQDLVLDTELLEEEEGLALPFPVGGSRWALCPLCFGGPSVEVRYETGFLTLKFVIHLLLT